MALAHFYTNTTTTLKNGTINRVTLRDYILEDMLEIDDKKQRLIE